MRKYGLGFMIFGGAFGAVLFAVRCSDWYRAASLQTYSEPAQLVEAAFWACVITLLLGLVFLLLSLRRSDLQSEPEPEPEEEPEYEPDSESFEDDFGESFADAYEAAHIPSATQPFDFDAYEPAAQPEEDPAATRQFETRDGWTCAICGCTNPDFSAVCAVCGASRGSAPL